MVEQAHFLYALGKQLGGSAGFRAGVDSCSEFCHVRHSLAEAPLLLVLVLLQLLRQATPASPSRWWQKHSSVCRPAAQSQCNPLRNVAGNPDPNRVVQAGDEASTRSL